MKEFTASSGAKVAIGFSSWDDTMNLKNAALREFAKAGISLKGLTKETDIGSLLSALLSVESSPEVYAALWPCLLKSTYNGHKITKGTFEDHNARQDYYEIIKEYLVVNVTPFLSPRVLEFWEKLKTTQSDIPKSI